MTSCKPVIFSRRTLFHGVLKQVSKQISKVNQFHFTHLKIFQNVPIFTHIKVNLVLKKYAHQQYS